MCIYFYAALGSLGLAINRRCASSHLSNPPSDLRHPGTDHAAHALTLASSFCLVARARFHLPAPPDDAAADILACDVDRSISVRVAEMMNYISAYCGGFIGWRDESRALKVRQGYGCWLIDALPSIDFSFVMYLSVCLYPSVLGPSACTGLYR